MIESFKKFRKRRLSNDPILAFFSIGACGKVVTHEQAAAADAPARQTFVKKDDDEIEISNKQVVVHVAHEGSSENGCVLTRHPMEPTGIDHPIRCPHPEPCIIQDGRALRERLPSTKRRGQLPFLTAGEIQRLRWNRRSAPNDCQIYPTASAPEHSLIDALIS